MRILLTNNASDIVKAILINIALEKRNAQLLCGTDGERLDLLIEAALNQKDQLLLKIVRNIAIHSGPTQAMFSVNKNLLGLKCLLKTLLERCVKEVMLSLLRRKIKFNSLKKKIFFCNNCFSPL